MNSQLEPSFHKSDFMAFHNIISKLTNGIQALNNSSDFLRKKYDTRMEENF